MTWPPGGSSKPLSSTALRELISDLAGKIERLEQEVEQFRLDNSNLRRLWCVIQRQTARVPAAGLR
ncbi:hypothetical protein [Microvirga sp. P5_D2]